MDLKNTFLSLFGELADSVLETSQVAEAEINSNNFRILAAKHGDNKYFLLRRYPKTSDVGRIAAVHRAIHWLSGKGIPAPELLDAKDNFAVFKFLDSDHYRGTLPELESCALNMGKMDVCLSEMPADIADPEMFKMGDQLLKLREFSESIWRDIFSLAEARYKKTGDDFDAQLIAAKDEILKAIRETPADVAKSFPRQIVHFDFHPHNILTDGNKLSAFLDFDSLRYLERMRGVAFAAHRLIRQYVIFNKSADIKKAVSAARKIFFENYKKFGVLTAEEEAATAYFIRHESLSRLTYAMKDMYYNGNPAWKQDLPKQMGNIAESYYF